MLSRNTNFILGIVVFNHAETAFSIRKGDRIAQLICEKISTPGIEVLEELGNTERGKKGFGSTDENN